MKSQSGVGCCPVVALTEADRQGQQADAYIASRIGKLFDMRPAAIIERFALKNPIYEPCASYGHMGREPYVRDGMQFFGWEKLDAVERIREEFRL